MTQVFGRMVDLYIATLGERNFIEQIRAPIFLEGVLAIDIVRAPIESVPSLYPGYG